MGWPDVIHALQTSVPIALAAFGAATTALIAVITKISTAIEDGKRAKRAKSVPPIAIAPTQAAAPFAAPPPTDPLMLARVELHSLDAALMGARWREDTLRRTVDDLVKDGDQKTKALVEERELRQRAEVRVQAKDAQIATLENALELARAERDQRQRELDASVSREMAAARELARYKQDVNSGHSTQPVATITPLRPPRSKGKP